MSKTVATTFAFVIGLIVGAGGFFLISETKEPVPSSNTFNTQSNDENYRCESSRDGSSYFSSTDESGTRTVVYSSNDSYENFTVVCTQV